MADVSDAKISARIGQTIPATRAAAAAELEAADRAHAVRIQVGQVVLDRALPRRALVIGPERHHVRGSRDEQLRARGGERPRRLRELDVEADQRTDVEAGEADDL